MISARSAACWLDTAAPICPTMPTRRTRQCANSGMSSGVRTLEAELGLDTDEIAFGSVADEKPDDLVDDPGDPHIILGLIDSGDPAGGHLDALGEVTTHGWSTR